MPIIPSLANKPAESRFSGVPQSIQVLWPMLRITANLFLREQMEFVTDNQYRILNQAQKIYDHNDKSLNQLSSITVRFKMLTEWTDGQHKVFYGMPQIETAVIPSDNSVLFEPV